MINRRNCLRVLVIVLVFGVAVSGFAQSTGRANFGNYPVDYALAHASAVGLTKIPTVRTLFGPEAHFLTSFNGVPTRVTIESSNGTQTRFTAQLLVTLIEEQGERNFFRMNITFDANNTTEMSYIRQINAVSLLTGDRSEVISRGDPRSEGEVIGFFSEIMVVFWDKNQYINAPAPAPTPTPQVELLPNNEPTPEPEQQQRRRPSLRSLFN